MRIPVNRGVIAKKREYTYPNDSQETFEGFYDYSGVDVKELMGQRIRKLLVLLKDMGYG